MSDAGGPLPDAEARAERAAAIAEELLGDARRLARDLHAAGLSEWTLGLADLIDDLARRAKGGA